MPYLYYFCEKTLLFKTYSSSHPNIYELKREYYFCFRTAKLEKKDEMTKF